jgi:hypothetical protein
VGEGEGGPGSGVLKPDPNKARCSPLNSQKEGSRPEKMPPRGFQIPNPRDKASSGRSKPGLAPSHGACCGAESARSEDTCSPRGPT